MREAQAATDMPPLLQSCVEAFNEALGTALDQVWLRPNGPALMEGFLAGQVQFLVGRDAVLVLARQ